MHNKNQMYHSNSVSQQASRDMLMVKGCGVTWPGVQTERYYKQGVPSQTSLKLYSGQYQRRLFVYCTEHRMDAEYKRINGEHQTEEEPSTRVNDLTVLGHCYYTACVPLVLKCRLCQCIPENKSLF